jgi:predicted nuclease of predicted toxin-antitoxin system
MTLRFVIDAQLPPALAKFLETQGHSAVHVNHMHLRGSSDAHIWSYVIRKEAVLVTKDEDFIVLAERSLKVRAVVWVRVGNTRNRALLNIFSRALPDLLASINAGERIIVVE